MNNQKKNKFIQASFPHTGSTLVTNLLYGMFAPNKPVIFNQNSILKNKDLIIKTHNTDIDKLIQINSKYNVFIIATVRKNHPQFHNKFKNYQNVLFIQYDDILETDQNNISKICDFFFHQIQNFLPSEIFNTITNNQNKQIIIQNMIQRINQMNQECDKLKDKPFNIMNKFFQIHGSHRNRK